MKNNIDPADLPDVELIAEVTAAALHKRRATARLIALLLELDTRRLYLGAGCSSLFTYCTRALHLSEHAAYGRIEAARAARQYPVVLDVLEAGALNLTSVGLLRPHLTTENHRELLASAAHRSKREVEALVARLRPQPEVPSSVRKLPQPRPASATPPVVNAPVPTSSIASSPAGIIVATSSAQSKPASVKPVAPDRYRIQITVSRETHERLRRVQDLLRHSVPTGDPAEIFDRALSLLLEHLERIKLTATARPRVASDRAPASRHIPAAVRRAVWTRDAGRCAFVGTEGRCTETGFLEFHHIKPYADGGAATLDNIGYVAARTMRTRRNYSSVRMWRARGVGSI